jgi:hypothetical protein
MPEPEILTDPHQMLLRALAAKDDEIDRLRDGLLNALAAIDWMFAAQQPLRDPWFTHRDALIARARDALGNPNGA